jgi:adenine/guanine phosphoribosyltransferase-like PRPP-binding protein
VKLPLYLLALRFEDEIRQRPRVHHRGSPVQERAAWPLRWPRKLATAVPTMVRVFRRQMATPATGTIDPGTPVVTSRGRSLGVVRSLVVEIGTGGTAYAVSLREGDAGVVLLPRQTLRETDEVAVVDDRIVRRLELMSA